MTAMVIEYNKNTNKYSIVRIWADDFAENNATVNAQWLNSMGLNHVDYMVWSLETWNAVPQALKA